MRLRLLITDAISKSSSELRTLWIPLNSQTVTATINRCYLKDFSHFSKEISISYFNTRCTIISIKFNSFFRRFVIADSCLMSHALQSHSRSSFICHLQMFKISVCCCHYSVSCFIFSCPKSKFHFVWILIWKQTCPTKRHFIAFSCAFELMLLHVFKVLIVCDVIVVFLNFIHTKWIGYIFILIWLDEITNTFVTHPN